ncbi:MAG: nucleotidyltransferase family protein [Saprospiraceae bacterium]|nr:nucleotidyltransferase family protein [Saprospiraceae bacterium]
MNDYQKHLIHGDLSIREILQKLEKLGSDAILFLVDGNDRLLGSLTDGDIRRGLIRGLGLEDPILSFLQPNPRYFKRKEFTLEQMTSWREQNYRVIPVLDDDNHIIDIINFRIQRSYLPIDAVIMAGGMGQRLRPLTLNTPKALLKVAGKPIIDYNIERLISYGVRNYTLTIKYLGQQIRDHLGDGSSRKIQVRYYEEEEPLGTIGAIRMVEHFKHDYVLVMNSDLLTDINFEDLYRELVEKSGDMIIATTPYQVKIPYGVIEPEGDHIKSLREKPTYTYYSNAGIYLFRKEMTEFIPPNQHFDATDLMNVLIENGKKVLHFPILGYWLDIGRHQDFEKAQNDIGRLRL